MNQEPAWRLAARAARCSRLREECQLDNHRHPDAHMLSRSKAFVTLSLEVTSVSSNRLSMFIITAWIPLAGAANLHTLVNLKPPERGNDFVLKGKVSR
ncbi:hypothetical protein BDR03DRAFT_168268 [Suillus americanus]|nr:hypothetical protein BDR03DRAFT_168268 [Suillus americanus]